MADVVFTEDNFQDEVLNEKGVVLVDFYASWCGPCKMLSPVIDELAEEYKDKCRVGKVDVEESKGLSTKFGVQSIPTIIIFKDGEEAGRLVGFQSKEALKEHIDELVA